MILKFQFFELLILTQCKSISVVSIFKNESCRDSYYWFFVKYILFLVSNDLVTVEPFFAAEYCLHIQRIGNVFKVYKRELHGERRLIRTSMTDRFKEWINLVARLFQDFFIYEITALYNERNKKYTITKLKGSFLISKILSLNFRQLFQNFWIKLNGCSCSKKTCNMNL